jgi:glutamate N-acetyltransferase/amino-acid N-acetyltransferase
MIDSFMLIATGAAENRRRNRFACYAACRMQRLTKHCQELAHMIVRDGEGGDQVHHVAVEDGASVEECHWVALFVTHN